MKRNTDRKTTSAGAYLVRAAHPGCLPYMSIATFTPTKKGTDYADVAPGSSVRVKLQANFSVNWSGLGQENSSGFNFYASAGENVLVKICICFILLFMSVLPQGHCLEPQLFSCEPRTNFLPHTSTSNVCALNISQRHLTSIFSDIALQNFTAECDTIAAVKLKIEGDGGLGKFELLRSTNDGLGKPVFTAWVRKDKSCGALGYITIPVGGIPVKRGEEYFIRFTGNSQQMRLLARQGDKYREGDGYGKKSALFIVLSQYDSAPYMRKISPRNAACLEYLAPVIISTETAALPEESGDGYDGDYGLDVCSDFAYIDEEKYISTDTVEGVAKDLFSKNSGVIKKAVAMLTEMPLKDRESVAKKVFEYYYDADPEIEDRARQILKTLEEAIRPVLPALIKEIENGPAERIKILSKVVSEKETVSYLMRLLRGTDLQKAEQASILLIGSGLPETRKPLAYYYYAHMKKATELFAAKAVVLDKQENLPMGCILFEFLPERFIKHLKKLNNISGVAVTFEIENSYSTDVPVRRKFEKFDSNAMTDILGKKAVLRYPIKVTGCDIREDILKEIKALK